MSKLPFLLFRWICVSITLATPLAFAQTRPTPTPTPTPTPSPPSLLGQQDDEQSPVAPEQQATNQSTRLETNQVGRTAKSSVGEVGQRQTRDGTASQTGVELMGRVASRIQNRVQNRLRTRVDRTYDPQANADDPFLVAQDQFRTINRPR